MSRASALRRFRRGWLLTVTVFLMMAGVSATPARNRLQLDDYVIYFDTPGGWALTHDVDSANLIAKDGASISLDWYQPPRDRGYTNFDARMRDEIGYRRKSSDGKVAVRHCRVGSMKAVRIESVENLQHHFLIETFVAVPTSDGGDLYVVTLDSPTPSAKSADVQRYDEFMRSLVFKEK